MIKHSILLLFCFVSTSLLAQTTLPSEVRITQDGRLTYGGNPVEGFYNPSDVHKLEITLTEPNWFQLMDGTGGPGGAAGQTLIGTLTVNDTLVLDSVLVSIKGQTSDFQNNSQKKSFKIEIDELKDQDLMGYDNLNLNGGFQDHSGMREVLFYDITKSFAPALKGAFVELYINGQSWGPYNNIQQIEGRYIKEWFSNNEGTRWRAVRPDDVGGGGGPGGGGGGPGGGGPGGAFGTGVSTLNYNGPDSTDYNENYTLKKTNKANPWEDLIDVCDNLNNRPISELYDSLLHSLDIDRTLWFLAQEAVFSDDDSYIHKGGMDYYVYWDQTTDRIIPLEVDANSVMMGNHVSWSPFYHENDTDFPLLNRMLQHDEVRQRYLAHLRTVLDLYFIEQDVHSRIDDFAAILDQRVQDDPKKIYTYSQYLTGVVDLKSFVSNRINFLAAHTEINRQGVGISNVVMEYAAGPDTPPQADEDVQIRVDIAGEEQKVVLYYGLGLDGMYDRVEMFDDGMHNDLLADDDVYGASIPGFSSGEYVRYYIEAIKNDNFSTASYFPPGAEHDVFIYQVEPTTIPVEDVAINEFMADNENSVADQAGEYDDWIELYNNGTDTVDLSGYYLSDKESNPTKWQFPEHTKIAPDGYLIVWADEDEDQASPQEIHANFKLSSGGEAVLLVNSEEEIIDQIGFGEQQADISFARIPNGIGNFQSRTPTFHANNDNSATNISAVEELGILIYPNPAQDFIRVEIEKSVEQQQFTLMILNAAGQEVIYKKTLRSDAQIDVADLSNGLYIVMLQDLEGSFLYHQKLMIMK
ncbi:MAG: CotH kinase family protein [Bacteroidota bacterium]